MSVLPEACISTGYQQLDRIIIGYRSGGLAHHMKRKKFIIYRDRCLKEEQLSIIKEKFGLNDAEYDIEYDVHYKCSKCNPLYID